MGKLKNPTSLYQIYKGESYSQVSQKGGKNDTLFFQISTTTTKKILRYKIKYSRKNESVWKFVAKYRF